MRVLKLIMKPAARYPADPRAFFILSFCALAGAPLIFADAAPGTIAAKLDHWQVIAWGLSLAVGSLITLLGMIRQSANGILFEQFGSICVGVAAVFYGATVLVVVGLSASFPAAITIGWGVSCFWRWAQLQELLNETERAVRRAQQAALEAEQAEIVQDVRREMGFED